jgi:hypothetical protein
MDNMHEFDLITQTWEYIVSIIGLVLFVPLWRAIQPRRKAH